jgi:hypothetical protein
MKRTSLFAAALLTTVLAVPAAAAAQDSSTELPAGFGAAQRVCTVAINQRIAVTRLLDRAAGRATALTEAHEVALADITEAVRSSLATLRDDIAAADDRDELESLCREIVNEHYVYRLRVPQHRLAITGDRLVVRAATLGEEADALEAEITAAGATGTDVTAAQAALAAMRDALAVAEAEAAPLGDAAIALTPSDVNAGGGAAATVLAPLRTDRGEARAALRDARQSAREIRQLLGLS